MLQEASSEGQPWPHVLPVAVWSGGRVSLPWIGRDWKLGELKVPGQARRAHVPSIWPPRNSSLQLDTPRGSCWTELRPQFSQEWRVEKGLRLQLCLSSYLHSQGSSRGQDLVTLK